MVTSGIIAKISESIGFDLSNEKSAELELKINSIASEFGFKDTTELCHELSKQKISQKLLISIAKHFTIGETYFFRDPYLMAALEVELSKLIQIRMTGERKIRVWSAGSSSGEELYSILFILDKLLRDFNQWDLTLIGTDINADAIKKAKEGIYTAWSFRSDKNFGNSKYFKPIESAQFQLKREYRNKAEFRFHNLIDIGYPNETENLFDFDLIICRNVLMYFSDEVRKKVVNRFFDCLNSDGLFCVSPTESMHPYFSKFNKLPYDQVTLFSKSKTEKAAENEFHTAKLGNGSVKFKEKSLKSRSIRENQSVNNRKEFEKKIILEPKNINSEKKKNIEEVIKELYDNNNYSQVEKYIEQHTENGADSSLINEYFIRACANQRKIDKALSRLSDLIKSDRTNAEYHYLLGNLFVESNKAEDAVEAYLTATYLDEEHVQSIIALGNIYSSKNMIRKANNYLEVAVNLLKNMPPEKIIDEIDKLSAADLLDYSISILDLRYQNSVI